MSDYITRTDDDDEETRGSSSVNRNNNFPDDILNITKFPTFTSVRPLSIQQTEHP